MFSKISSAHISDSCAHEDVRGVVLFGGIARQTDPCCKRIRPPLHPFILGISMRDDCSKSKAGGRVPGRERPSATPELTCAARSVRKLAIERELQSQVHGTGGSHRSECLESSIAQIGMVPAAPCSISQSSRSDLQAEANV